MKKNRLFTIFSIFSIAIFILVYRLFDLTIINGNKYREFSENNRIKQIEIDASRGIIFDRNGRELASNKPIYVLNSYADRFNRANAEDRNSAIKDLISIFEEDGVNYINPFNFDIYKFIYKTGDDYFKNDLLPLQKVRNILLEKSLLKDLLLSKVKIDENTEYFNIKRMVEYFNIRNKNLPIEIVTEDEISVKFENNEEYKKLLDSGELDGFNDPIEYIISIIEKDNSYLSYLLEHPLARKSAYEILEKNNLKEDILLSEVILNFDFNYIEHKSSLRKLSDKITLDSDPKSDFINLVKENSIQTLLTTAYKSNDTLVVPASILINTLERLGVSTELEISVDDNNQVSINYIKSKDSKTEPLDYLINLAIEKDILGEFIVDSRIVAFAQNSLFQNTIYPRIYLSNWSYSALSDKKDFIGNREENITEIFNDEIMRNGIEEENEYLKFSMLSIYNTIKSQGYLSYIPVTISEDIPDNTLIKIEERIPKELGFEVSAQTRRIYPNNELAAHTLGYVGKIFNETEIQDFVEYKKYSINDIIGKTGLEQSYEDTLRGSKGRKLVYTDVYGRTTETLEESLSVPGNNLYTTLDLTLQREVENILKTTIESINQGSVFNSYVGNYQMQKSDKARTGAAVVMDTNTGEVLAMASYPAYDPNLFVNGITNYEWNKLNDADEKDSYAPRAVVNNVMQAVIPGSTFKTVVGLAALEKGLNPDDPIENHGYIQLGSSRFHDLIYTTSGRVWGDLNLYDALKNSSNYYFYVLGLGYNPNKEGDNDIKVSIDDIYSITKRLGLQDKTGIEINIPGESRSYVPTVEGKKNLVRAMLRNMLQSDLAKYALNNSEIKDTKIANDINEIVSWVEKGNDITREEIAQNLREMGYNTEMILENDYEDLPRKIKFSYINQAVWTQADAVLMSIGQGQNAYTPLQMVQLAATFANDGTIVKPTLIREIKNFNDKEILFDNSVSKRNSEIASKHFHTVKEGMKRSAMAQPLRRNFPLVIGGKTGTAELGVIDENTGYQRVSVSEMTFSPFNAPEIATFVVIYDGNTSLNPTVASTDIIYAYNKFVKKDPSFSNTRPGESPQSIIELNESKKSENN